MKIVKFMAIRKALFEPICTLLYMLSLAAYGQQWQS